MLPPATDTTAQECCPSRSWPNAELKLKLKLFRGGLLHTGAAEWHSRFQACCTWPAHAHMHLEITAYMLSPVTDTDAQKRCHYIPWPNKHAEQKPNYRSDAVPLSGYYYLTDICYCYKLCTGSGEDGTGAEAPSDTATEDCCQSTPWPKAELELLGRRVSCCLSAAAKATKDCYVPADASRPLNTGSGGDMVIACMLPALHSKLAALLLLLADTIAATTAEDCCQPCCRWPTHTQMHLEITVNHPADAPLPLLSDVTTYYCYLLYFFYCYYCTYCTGAGGYLPPANLLHHTARSLKRRLQNWCTTQKAIHAGRYSPASWLNSAAERRGTHVDKKESLQAALYHPSSSAITTLLIGHIGRIIHRRTVEQIVVISYMYKIMQQLLWLLYTGYFLGVHFWVKQLQLLGYLSCCFYRPFCYTASDAEQDSLGDSSKGMPPNYTL